MVYNTIIVGGGAAGLMCAYQLSLADVDFVLLEKKETLGSKLLLTGGARCNVTNHLDTASFISSLTLSHKRFLYPALTQFGTKDIIDFFMTRNCPLQLEDNFKYFPKSSRSEDIRDVFLAGIPQKSIATNSPVNRISKEGDLFTVQTLKKQYKAKNVVIATGSKSFPHTGSSGDGLVFASDFGIAYHTFTPAETHVYAKQVQSQLISLQGSSLHNVTVQIKGHNKKVKGDVLFTHFGLSGPAIMHLSEDIYDVLETQKVYLQVPLTSKSRKELVLLFSTARTHATPIRKVLEQCCTKKIAKLLLELYLISNINTNEIAKDKEERLIQALLGYEIEIDRVQDVEKAYVNKGGVQTKELNPNSFETKNVPGLFFIGETVDLHGPIGGFNLTIAFSTAKACANEIITRKKHTM